MSKRDPAAQQCPYRANSTDAADIKSANSNYDWWPNQLKLAVLHQHSAEASPMAADFDYKQAFAQLDLSAVKQDLFELMTQSQAWWPADYGHYGPLFIRMAWHSAGTYRIHDGRGGARYGTQRFAPLNSWPDNANLDKARRLLWPIKQKYGRQLSWADLMILAGNCALESMGLKLLGFSGGRVDVWAPEIDIYWGQETEWLGDARYNEAHQLEQPLAAVQMGLIYVNPEGPNGQPDPVASARDIRETFTRMAMNDEETVALIAGGHTFGKCHGAASDSHLGPAPEGASLEQQGLGWHNTYGTGIGADTITSGIEGAWTAHPIRWDNGYFDVLFGYEWELTKSPAGAHQWQPKAGAGDQTVPDAHLADKRHAPMMTTADMALRMDPHYEAIARRYQQDHAAFSKAFAQAWFKLTHRDMGPVSCYVGNELPKETFVWQDPIPNVDHELVNSQDIAQLKAQLLASGLSVGELVRTAWAAASTFRASDYRGGANGARLALAPQKDWSVNQPEQLSHILAKLEQIKSSFNQAQSKSSNTSNKKISLADLIVLGGVAAIEQAVQQAGFNDISVPFVPGRMDALASQTDVASFAVLAPRADGFRNYCQTAFAPNAEHYLLDKAQLLTLTAPEMTVLVGGMRVLGANVADSIQGVFTDRVGVLSNDFFVNLLDNNTVWQPVDSNKTTDYQGYDRASQQLKWQATRVDLVFGANSQLRALAEVYASDDGQALFVHEFINAWHKVMMLDRFELG